MTTTGVNPLAAVVADATDNTWRDAEAALGLSVPCPAVRQRLSDSIAEYRSRRRTGPRLPVREMRKQLRKDIRLAASIVRNADAPPEIRRFFALSEERLARKLASIPPARGGRPSDLRPLIRELAKVWHVVTGKRATVTSNPYDIDGTNRYGGKFLVFVAAVLRAGGVPRPASNVAFGKLVQRSLKR